jgi:hypothetical protein
MIIPPSISLSGNRNVAAVHRNTAIKFYMFIARQADIMGVAHTFRTLPLADGSLIQVTTYKEGNYGLRTGRVGIVGAGGGVASKILMYICVYDKDANINEFGFLGRTFFISKENLAVPTTTFPLLAPIIANTKIDYNLGYVTTLDDKALPISQGEVSKHISTWINTDKTKTIDWGGVQLYINGKGYSTSGIAGTIRAAAFSGSDVFVVTLANSIFDPTILIITLAQLVLNPTLHTATAIHSVDLLPVPKYESEPICFEFSEDSKYLAITNILDITKSLYDSKKRYTIYRLDLDNTLFGLPTKTLVKVADWDVVEAATMVSSSSGPLDFPVRLLDNISYSEYLTKSDPIENSIDFVSFPKLHGNSLYAYGLVTNYADGAATGSYSKSTGAPYTTYSASGEYTLALNPSLSEVIIDMFAGTIAIVDCGITFEDFRIGVTHNRKGSYSANYSSGESRWIISGSGYSYISTASIYSVYFSDPYYKLLVVAISDVSTDMDYTLIDNVASEPYTTKNHTLYNIYNNNILTTFADINAAAPSTTVVIGSGQDPVTISNAESYGGTFAGDSNFSLDTTFIPYTQQALDQYTPGLCSAVTPDNIVVCIRDYVEDYTQSPLYKNYLKKTLTFSLKKRAATLTEIVDTDIRELGTPYDSELNISPITVEILN